MVYYTLDYWVSGLCPERKRFRNVQKLNNSWSNTPSSENFGIELYSGMAPACTPPLGNLNASIDWEQILVTDTSEEVTPHPFP
jgi:hypothetical protein